MKRLAATLSLTTLIASPLAAKGLDQLQPKTPAQDAVDTKESEIKDKKALQAQPEEGKGEAATDKKAVEAKNQAPAEPEAVIEPGFQNLYLGTSLSMIQIEGDKGSWHSSSTGDFEAGYKFGRLQDKYDLWATFRYRPADVTVDAQSRSYRGVVESYLFGAKGQMLIQPKLFGVASAELGLSKAYMNPIDGLQGSVGGLEKSGVDLNIGGGVSYLVLDKIALGAQLHLGFGTYKSTQFGVDLRFLL